MRWIVEPYLTIWLRNRGKSISLEEIIEKFRMLLNLTLSEFAPTFYRNNKQFQTSFRHMKSIKLIFVYIKFILWNFVHVNIFMYMNIFCWDIDSYIFPSLSKQYFLLCFRIGAYYGCVTCCYMPKVSVEWFIYSRDNEERFCICIHTRINMYHIRSVYFPVLVQFYSNNGYGIYL